ncbi:MAG: hypothetical protein O2904_05035 [bacterium]|nr:hypothetical protein [bacterium]
MNCAQCTSAFTVSDADREILKKASPQIGGTIYQIPDPTLCPNCRVQRRMTWRNDRTFYHRKCDKTGQMFISMYAPGTAFPVYKQDEWHGDSWEGLDYGRDYDFSRSFFGQWGELRDKVPHWGVAISNCENSDYCNYCTDEKNCYLDIAAEGNEDCYFDLFVKNSKNCVDCTFVYASELCYECIQCYNSYACRNSMYLDNCSDCTFCFDMKGCKDCVLSVNLRNKQYCLLNAQYTKEEYEKKVAELNLSSHASLQNVQKIWKNMRIDKGTYRDMYNLNCENAMGNNIKNSKNCYHCFNATDCEDCQYLYDVLNAKDCMDMNYSLYDPESSYEIMSTVGTKFCAFVMSGPYNSNSYYCQQLKSCKNCFGCHGLKNKEYCILNKQYTKEEYEELLPKIIEHMQGMGEWGEFFPTTLSPHGYNETVAQDYMPLSQADAESKGWSWRKEKEMTEAYMGPEATVADNIVNSDESICEQILTCANSGKQYKIISQELKFYKQQGIPLPRLCPAERHKQRDLLRNPRFLWQRQCSACQKEMWTSYDPERSEKVVCEECYLSSTQ